MRRNSLPETGWIVTVPGDHGKSLIKREIQQAMKLQRPKNILGGALSVCASAFALCCGGDLRAAETPATLAPHRAVYDVTLAAARGGSGVSAVSGRIAYELTGSACEGYTQVMRFVTRMINQSGGVALTDLRSSTWEDGNAKRFRFDSSQYRDEKLVEITTGDSMRSGPGGDLKVDLTKPGKKRITLPARVYLPMEHTITLIGNAKAGKTSLRANLFDGSEKGEKVYDTRAAIGKAQPPAARKLAEVKNAERLKGLRAWPVSIAYFEQGADRSDALPVYELAFLMFENGVSRKLHIDYGGFALSGELREITFHSPSRCERK
jgi:hypothetical protein